MRTTVPTILLFVLFISNAAAVRVICRMMYKPMVTWPMESEKVMGYIIDKGGDYEDDYEGVRMPDVKLYRQLGQKYQFCSSMEVWSSLCFRDKTPEEEKKTAKDYSPQWDSKGKIRMNVDKTAQYLHEIEIKKDKNYSMVS